MPRILFNSVLLTMGLGMVVLFFIIKTPGGDHANVGWRLSLTRMHLSHQLAMPYFSPAHCGGFHLAADAQDLIFSLYMAAAFFIPNVDWAIKITDLLSTLILGGGIFVLLKFFGILNPTVRIFTSILVCISGYWVCHIAQGGHVWGQGFAYLPWILICIEEVYRGKIGHDRRTRFFILALIGLFFLLINSGYYWLQVAAPILVLRFMIEIILAAGERKPQALKTGLILLALAGALALSFPRLAGVYEFQLKKFPRLGGEVSPFQIIGGQKWYDLTFRSYFDGSIIRESQFSEFMGFAWDYSNFIGLCALLPLAWGLCRCREKFNNRLFITLGLGALFQLGLTQGHHIVETLRFFVPLFKQITWYSRGSGMVLLFMAVLIAIGMDDFIRSKKVPFAIIALLMVANLMEILYVQCSQIDFKLNPPLSEFMHDTNPPPYPADRSWGPCLLGYVYGYGNEQPVQLQADLGAPFSSEPRPGFYNMHDVRLLGSTRADGGYYLKEKWPLWPRKDHQEFEKFIHYQQVVPLPGWLQAGNWASLVMWLIFLMSWGVLLL